MDFPLKLYERVAELVRRNPNQLTQEEYLFVGRTLSGRSPCNLLVFGVGRDSNLWIDINEGGHIVTNPESLAQRAKGGFGVGHMSDHIRDFLDNIKTRGLTSSNPELAQRAHTICHCANLCLRLGRKLRWDPKSERFVDDAEANRMLNRVMRAPWRV